jgi:hypothetical protein
MSKRQIFPLAFLFTLSLASTGQASTILAENFDNIATLGASGWVQTSNSAAGWIQGNSGVFTSQAGAGGSYIAANFNGVPYGRDITSWLITPGLTLDNGDTLSFYTRTAGGFPDGLEVRMSSNGASTNVSDFTTLLLSINPARRPGGYPDSWTLFSMTLSGLGGATSGRLAFRYGTNGVNDYYIGIDTVSVSRPVPSALVPEPVTLATLGGGLAAARLRRRRR